MTSGRWTERDSKLFSYCLQIEFSSLASHSLSLSLVPTEGLHINFKVLPEVMWMLSLIPSGRVKFRSLERAAGSCVID